MTRARIVMPGHVKATSPTTTDNTPRTTMAGVKDFNAHSVQLSTIPEAPAVAASLRRPRALPLFVVFACFEVCDLSFRERKKVVAVVRVTGNPPTAVGRLGDQH